MCSTTLWFIVLLPQVWKNFRRKSVRGLSVLWATSNFTASLINLFFVFIYAKIPLYGQISSVYCPILEFALLVQFWIYGKYRKILKIIYAAVCGVTWAVVIAVELIFEVENFIEYVAIVLWCIETFPQVLLNMKLQTTSGQATGSVVIAMLGKTTDFFANNILVMPIQYVIMCYFSSSVAYVNGFQVAWYYGNEDHPKIPDQTGSNASNNQTMERNVSGSELTSSYSINNDFPSALSASQTKLTTNTPDGLNSAKIIFVVRWLSMAIISCLLLMCVIGFTLNVESFLGLLGPTTIGLVLLMAHVYFTYFKRSHYALS
ncbi:unnamed protein product [Mytilus coruscus]|uniref:Uncharacterized protein n=1 Tax=Mytilus coruscus TaxID=42192 RepID=A0A6J8DGB1_MYTCO|nr:unnamed protein product [Mytilus coruscus]